MIWTLDFGYFFFCAARMRADKETQDDNNTSYGRPLSLCFRTLCDFSMMKSRPKSHLVICVMAIFSQTIRNSTACYVLWLVSCTSCLLWWRRCLLCCRPVGTSLVENAAESSLFLAVPVCTVYQTTSYILFTFGMWLMSYSWCELRRRQMFHSCPLYPLYPSFVYCFVFCVCHNVPRNVEYMEIYWKSSSQ